MKYTGNYNLKKPEGTDVVNIDDLNDNADIIDQKIKEIEDSVENIEVPVTSVNNKTGDVQLTADDVGAETPAGAQTKANTAESNAKTYADGVGTAANAYTDQEVGTVADDLASHKNENATQAHKAKNIAIDDSGNHFNATNVEGALEELFTSVSNGKNKLEAAITDKGGTVSKQGSIATFDELDTGIRSIPQAKGNALPSDVLSGKTFSSENAGIEVTGTMPNQGRKIITPGTTNKAIPQGYHDGTGYVQGSANLKPENIKSGVNIFGIVGSLRSFESSLGSSISISYNREDKYAYDTGTFYEKIIDLPTDCIGFFLTKTDTTELGRLTCYTEADTDSYGNWVGICVEMSNGSKYTIARIRNTNTSKRQNITRNLGALSVIYIGSRLYGNSVLVSNSFPNDYYHEFVNSSVGSNRTIRAIHLGWYFAAVEYSDASIRASLNCTLRPIILG